MHCRKEAAFYKEVTSRVFATLQLYVRLSIRLFPVLNERLEL